MSWFISNPISAIKSDTPHLRNPVPNGIDHRGSPLRLTLQKEQRRANVGCPHAQPTYGLQHRVKYIWMPRIEGCVDGVLEYLPWKSGVTNRDVNDGLANGWLRNPVRSPQDGLSETSPVVQFGSED